MGLLDDAIREHLELKRRHGADPDEVARQEEEVLGASQRAAEFAPTDDEPAEAPAAEAPAEPEPPAGDRTVAVAASSLEADEIPPPEEPEAAPTGADEDPWLEETRDEVPAEDALERPAAPPADAPQGEEDVLEETPDFLQETPEHDRLWFEQRPPRDFDWDK